MPEPAELPIVEPKLQISFYYRLQTVRRLYFGEALGLAVQRIDLTELDSQLAGYVNNRALRRVASSGLRGEVFFPVPLIIKSSPFLLGYYRLLFGLSQKEFYRGPFSRFKPLEEQGEIPMRLNSALEPLCRSLVKSGEILVGAIDELALDIVHDLQLLTLGPQFRGSANTRIGQGASREFFELIRSIAGASIREVTGPNHGHRELFGAHGARRVLQ